MTIIPAPRNRTLNLTDEDRVRLRNRVSRLPVTGPDALINGDTFAVLPKLERTSFDLLFADPPYNLTKQFGSQRFKSTDDDAYEEWLESWLLLTAPLLTATASVYICGDWRS